MARRGRPPTISAERREVLVGIAGATPGATLTEIQAELQHPSGLAGHEQTIVEALKEAGVERRRAGAGRWLEAAAPARRYGYTQAYRRWEPAQTYPSVLLLLSPAERVWTEAMHGGHCQFGRRMELPPIRNCERSR
jgi:hypothetical protein